MCEKCSILHLHSGFSAPSQFWHEIDKIRALVKQGDMTIQAETAPLLEINGSSQGLLRYELQCVCGQRLVIFCENGEGALRLL
ncbi:MAG: hypothetical protein ACI4KM_05080 [Oscillospiraceae bacterium]